MLNVVLTNNFIIIFISKNIISFQVPSFHMSILWWNGNWKESISKHTEELNSVLTREKEDFKVVNIQKVDCKVGNKYYQFHLD